MSEKRISKVADTQGKYRHFTGIIKWGKSEGKVKNATFELKNRTVIWKDGTWKDGTWEYGVWENGTWYDGTWENGTWYDGEWQKGTWIKGKISVNNQFEESDTPPESS